MTPPPESTGPPLDEPVPPERPSRPANQPSSRNPIDGLPEFVGSEVSDVTLESETDERSETRPPGMTLEGTTPGLTDLAPNGPEPHELPEIAEVSTHDPAESFAGIARRWSPDGSGRISATARTSVDSAPEPASGTEECDDANNPAPAQINAAQINTFPNESDAPRSNSAPTALRHRRVAVFAAII
jgi:hypothetical protein